MGMSASQARLIELTARMNDVEYEGQQINQQRQTLANKMNEIYNQAMTLEVPTAPSKIDFRTDAYSGKIGSQRVDLKKNDDGNWSAIKTTRAWTCYNTTGIVGTNDGQPESRVLAEPKSKISKSDFETYEKLGAKAKVNGIEVSIKEALKELSPDSDDNYTLKDSAQIILPNKSGFTVDGNKTYDMNFAKVEFAENTNFNNALKGLKNYVESSSSDGTFDESKYTVIFEDGDTQKFKFILTDNLKVGEANVLGAEEDTSAKVKLSVKEVRYDANGCVEKITVINDDGEEKVIEVAVNSAAYDDIAYDAAMREYEAKKIAYDYEQNEFNKRTSIYQQQDKQLELKLTRLDNERNALNTEIEAVKKVIQDAIDKGFKTFSG